MAIPNLNIGNFFGALSAGKEAIQKDPETKGTKFGEKLFKKVGIFFTAFLAEMTKVEGEEKQTSSEADKKAAEKVDVTMQGATTALALDPKIQGDDKKLFDEIVAIPVGKFGLLEADDATSGKVGLSKLQDAMDGKKPEMKYDEVASLVAVGLMSFQELKKHYKNEPALAAALKQFSDTSNSSKYPIGKLLSSLGALKLGDQKEGLKFLNAIGIKASAGDIFSFAGTKGVAVETGELLADIGADPMKREAELAKFFKERIFPNTVKVDEVVRAINRLVTGKLTATETKESLLANLIFLIDDSDYDRLIKILVGPTGKPVG